jgi:hypothetical protein
MNNEPHLKFRDPVDEIYCPVVNEMSEFRTFVGDDQPAATECGGCHELLDHDPELAHHVEVGTEWFCDGEAVETVQISHGYYEPPDHKCTGCGELVG